MAENKSSLLEFWNKVPLVIRALLLGFLISTIGVLCWSVVATIIPMPWSVILMIILLVIYIAFFSGRWWWDKTKSFRSINFRLVKLNGKTWFFGLMAALLIVIIEQSGLVVTFRLIEFPAERFTSEYAFLESVPLWAAWLVIVMISAVAGICEEIGFRGYMQKPLEDRYGPLVAIGIVSVMFVVVHLHQAWSGPLIVHIFFISVLFGTLAYTTGSIIPGIIAHFIMDICNFSFWWSGLGWQFHNNPISKTGIDQQFIMWGLIFLLATSAFVYINYKLKSLNQKITSV